MSFFFVDSAEMVIYLHLIAEICIRSQGTPCKISSTEIGLGNRHFAKNIHLYFSPSFSIPRILHIHSHDIRGTDSWTRRVSSSTRRINTVRKKKQKMCVLSSIVVDLFSIIQSLNARQRSCYE
jgi:hypothetical protein